MNFTAGSTVMFNAAEQSNFSGVENFGNLHLGGGGVRLQAGAIHSYGSVTVSSSLDLDSDEESVFGGGGLDIQPGASMSMRGRVSLEGPMRNQGSLNISGASSRLRISTPGSHSTIATARLDAGTLDVAAGSVAIDSIDSGGHVNISAGVRVEFGAGGGRIGGGGMNLAAGSSVASSGDLEFEAGLVSDGLVDVSAGTMTMSGAGANSSFGGGGAIVGEGAALHLGHGARVTFSGSLTSTGLLRANGSTAVFGPGLTAGVIGGQGLEAHGNASVVFDGTTAGVSRLVIGPDATVAVGGGANLQLAGSLDAANATAIEGAVAIDSGSSLELLLGLASVGSMNSTGQFHLGELAELSLDSANFSGTAGVSIAGSLLVGAATDTTGRRLQSNGRARTQKVRIGGTGGLQAGGGGAIRLERGSTLQLATDPGAAASDLGDFSSDGALEVIGSPATITARAVSTGLVSVSDGGVLTVDAPASAASTIDTADLSDGGRLVVRGDLRLGRLAGGAIEVEGSARFGRADGEAELDGADFENRGSMVVDGNGLSVTGGRFAGNGSLALGARLAFSAGADGATHVLDGPVTASTNGSLEVSTATAVADTPQRAGPPMLTVPPI